MFFGEKYNLQYNIVKTNVKFCTLELLLLENLICSEKLYSCFILVIFFRLLDH